VAGGRGIDPRIGRAWKDRAVAAFLALLAAAFFALAAALQQRGQFALAREGEAIKGVGELLRLLVIPVWLLS
jgi:hypothetical protein